MASPLRRTSRRNRQVFDPRFPPRPLRLLLCFDLTAGVEEHGGIRLWLQVASGLPLSRRTDGDAESIDDGLTPEKPPKYSRCGAGSAFAISSPPAAGCAKVEAIRGVSAVSAISSKALEDRGWIEVIGHKDTPGRPALYATTKSFLNSLSFAIAFELPLAELDAHRLSSCRRYRRNRCTQAGRIDDVNESDDLPGAGGTGHAASSAGERRRALFEISDGDAMTSPLRRRS